MHASAADKIGAALLPGFIDVVATGKIAAIDFFDVAACAQVNPCSAVAGSLRQDSRPMAAREYHRMARPVAEVRAGQSIRGCQAAAHNSGNHVAADIGCIDDVKNRVIGFQSIGDCKTCTQRSAYAVRPVCCRDHNDAGRCRYAGGAEHQNHVAAPAVPQRPHCGVKPLLDKYLRLSVTSPGPGGQQHSDDLCHQITPGRSTRRSLAA